VANIWHDEAAGTWLLEMRSSAYAFGLADDGSALRHLHWGAPLARQAVAGLMDSAAAGPSAREEQFILSHDRPDEYVPWGGLRFDEPTLKVDYADGTRGIEWRFEDQRVTRDGAVSTLEIDFRDTSYDLLVTLFYRVYDGFDVLERWACPRHRGSAGAPGIVLRQAHSANWWLPARDNWRLRYLHGGWGAETQLTQTTLAPGKFVLESRRGTTSHQFNPWFTLDPGGADGGAATEESGEVWSGELAWSGSWKIVYELTPGGRVHASGGLNDFDWAYDLAAGEELSLPPFAALYTAAGFGGASREWHAWQRAHVLGGRAPRPVLYNSWEATTFAVNQPGQEQLAELAARLGVECFVVDDGWFTGRDNDRAGLGDWSVDRSKFPDGLGPLIEKVNGLGMRFGLWVEPEMTNPDSDLYRAHPDWVYHFANRTRTQRRNQLVLNLARPDVAAWVFATIDGLLSENNIEFVKWDMNRPISEPGWPAGAGLHPERVWVDHVRNLYAILDNLRAAHPGVEFESCCGGGGRVDLGILRRVEQVWTSDDTDAWDRVRIQEGFTQAYTPQAMMAWVTDSPNPMTGRELPLSFRFHVAMAGALGIGGDLARWSPAELAEAAELVAAYKDIRPVVQQGRLYRVASVAKEGFGSHEYVAADGSEVVVLLWRGPEQGAGRDRWLRLAGLDPDARYRDAGTGREHQAAVLMGQGLRLPADVGAAFASTLVRLIRALPCRAASLRRLRPRWAAERVPRWRQEVPRWFVARGPPPERVRGTLAPLGQGGCGATAPLTVAGQNPRADHAYPRGLLAVDHGGTIMH
jgi:alpha-galactosidase